jgi:hypothetical protein
VGFAHFVILSGVEKNTLGRGRFSRVNVSGDPDISYPFHIKCLHSYHQASFPSMCRIESIIVPPGYQR